MVPDSNRLSSHLNNTLMATQAQKKLWTKVGISMIVGFLLVMIGVIKMDDMRDLIAGIIIGIGAVLFIGAFILLLGGTKQ
jgi:hypothetical protein